MNWKKILNEVGASAITAVGASLASTLVGRVAPQVHPKCTIHTPLAFCTRANCFVHAIDKRRAASYR